jgi:uncharacterized DUF497 family protein
MPVFRFDSPKSSANKAKHGIDCVEAQALWDNPELLEIPVRTEDEPTYIVIGRLGRSVWSAVITYRNDEIRIISVRRARASEVKLYESQKVR